MSGIDAPEVDADRVIGDLRRLAAETSSDSGAQRLCWGVEWRHARELVRASLAEIGVEEIERDEAGNLWARLPGKDRSTPALGIGSHIDSVPDGGWLDGALGVMAGIGVLRAWAESGRTPPRDVVLIDFADEEGARFGRSLFGSSALSGTLSPAELHGVSDAAGRSAQEVLAANGVELERAPDAAARLGSIGTWLELHIEQGPVLDSEGWSCSAVSGCAGVERHWIRFRGQAAHAGTTPLRMRHDAGLAAAETALAVERTAREAGGVGTSGRIDLRPGVVTAVPGAADSAVDLRHPNAASLREMLTAVESAARDSAGARGCSLSVERIWSIEPIPFDGDLVAAAERSCSAAGGRPDAIPSGALHDAAELARRVPAAMVFARSKGGLSHAAEEDTHVDDLRASISAYGRLAAAAI